MAQFIPTKQDLAWMIYRLKYLADGQRWFTETAHYQKIGKTLYCVQSINETNQEYTDTIRIIRDIDKIKICIEAIGWKFRDIRISNN